MKQQKDTEYDNTGLSDTFVIYHYKKDDESLITLLEDRLLVLVFKQYRL